jgi:hypothetical protein
MRAEFAWIEPDASHPLSYHSGVLAGGHTSRGIAPTRKQQLARLKPVNRKCSSSACRDWSVTRELTQAVTALVGRYHDASAPAGRDHRLVIVSHPLPKASQ